MPRQQELKFWLRAQSSVLIVVTLPCALRPAPCAELVLSAMRPDIAFTRERTLGPLVMEALLPLMMMNWLQLSGHWQTTDHQRNILMTIKGSTDQMLVMQEIAELSDRLIVMSQLSSQFLQEIFKVPGSKIDMVRRTR